MIFNKALFMILLPVITSCNLHYCCRLDIIDPEYQDFTPRAKEELSDSYRDGTDGIDIIDIPFA